MNKQSLLQFAIENPGIVLLFGIMIGLYLLEELYLKPSSKPGYKKKTRNKLDPTLKISDRKSASGIIFGTPKKGNKNKVLYSPAEAEGHVLVVGGSGMGKTSCLLIPTIRSWGLDNPKNTCFVIDISGDINPNCNIPNKVIYAPRNPNSTPYNIFGFIDSLPSREEQILALDKLSELIVGVTDEGATDAGNYYKSQGLNMLQAALIAYYYQGLDFINICNKINKLSYNNLMNDIDNSGIEEAIKRIDSFAGTDEMLGANAKQTLCKQISLFIRDPYICKNIRRPKPNEIAFEPSLIEDHNCFIMIPDEDLNYYRQLTQVLTAQTLNYFKGRPLDSDHTILMALDEASSLGAIQLKEPLQKYRKHKIRLLVLLQSLADIDITWGRDEKASMMSNFRYKVVLESSEPNEQDYWARAIGNETQISKSQTKNTITESERKDFIIEPSELANMGDNLLLRFKGGYRVLKKNPYYK